jgi:ketosteroid isomerase-like protein
MKQLFFPILIVFISATSVSAQEKKRVAGEEHQKRQEILALIDNYSLARETQDTVLLKSILTPDIDQLVSSGEWRYGMKGSMKGMAQSTAGNPGTRKLTVENIRFLHAENAIADARYEIQNADGTTRKMWSTFIVIYHKKSWKITAIRNMLPAGQ